MGGGWSGCRLRRLLRAPTVEEPAYEEEDEDEQHAERDEAYVAVAGSEFGTLAWGDQPGTSCIDVAGIGVFYT